MRNVGHNANNLVTTPRQRSEALGPVRQLSATDSMLLYMDAPKAPLALGLLLIYAPVPDEDADARYGRLLQHFERCVNSLPGFRRATVRAPLDLDNAWFVDGVDLDLTHHVRRHTLPSPGSAVELGEAYAELFSHSMDLERPLWEIHVFDGVNAVDGLPKDSFAVIYKFHHSSFDGGTVHRLVEELHSTSPARDNSVPPPYQAIATPRPPSVAKAIRGGAARHARFAAAVGRLIASRVSGRSAKRGAEKSVEENVEPASSVPRTIFNNIDMATRRHFAYVSLDFDDIRKVRKAVPGMTVNDVYHAVVGGALRRYLTERDALPSESLVTLCTVSTRAEEDKEAAGNDATGMRLSLGTNEPDPLRRLQIIHDAAIAAKAKIKPTGEAHRSSGDDLTSVVPAALVAGAISLMRLVRLISWMPAKFNVITVNIPGPAQTLYLDGAELVDFAGAPPVMFGAGLMIKATSYNNALKVALHASVEAVPDINVLLTHMRASLTELLEAAK